jgi:hypothetical protein
MRFFGGKMKSKDEERWHTGNYTIRKAERTDTDRGLGILTEIVRIEEGRRGSREEPPMCGKRR